MATNILTDAQIAGAAKAAGFSGAALEKIVAIALAESSGNTYAHNKIPPDNSYGLTQINMLGALGPERRKKFGLKSNEELFNPNTNMRVAYAISNGGKNFIPWSTYTSGAFLRYMSRAKKAAGNPSEAPSTPNPGGSVQQVGVTDTISGLVTFLKMLGDPNTWLRLGMMSGGAALVLISLYMISGQASKVKQAASLAAEILPAGKVLKAVK